MRVISGKARGTKLLSLDGLSTRPTTDRVKETMFNIIQFSIADGRVLDLFGGSGALGIEALSRGALEAVFVDENKKAINIINQNLDKTRLSGSATVLCSDYSSYLNKGTENPFDLIFLDPPYSKNILPGCIKMLHNKKFLSKNTIIVAECEKNDIIEEIDGINLVKSVLLGNTKLVFLKVESV